MSSNVQMIIAMAAYMLVVLAIGFYYGNKNKTSEDYFLGGRSLGPWVTAMSAEASDMSSWLLMGLPGTAYLTGFGDAGWTAIGLILGTWLNWQFISKRLRKYTEVCKNSFTIPDFFSNRFRDEKKVLMTLSAIMMVIFFTVYTASGFKACGTLFETILGLPYLPTMIICSIVIILYTSVGGFLAASTTDLVQGLLMSFAILVVLVMGIQAAGSVQTIIEHGQSLEGYFSLLNTHDPVTGKAASYGIISMVSGLAWGLGYFGMPHILVRFMAISTTKELKKSKSIAMIWVLISLIVSVLIGFTGAAIYAGELGGAGQASAETIFILMTVRLLPALMAGVVLSGILAATMSTADSQLLMVSSSIAQNLYKGIFKKDATEKQILIASRLSTVAVAVVGVIIAADQNSSIFNIVSYAWSGFGAAFGPLVLFSLFWKRTTLKGAVAGMLSGGIVSLVWSLYISKLGGWFGVYSILPAFIISSLLIVVVSLLDKEPAKEIQDEFDQVEKANI